MKDKKTSKKALGWIVYILVMVGLIYGIPKVLSYTLKTPYPMAAITSSSMWPTLKQGDLVFIKGINDKEDISVGDIVVYDNRIGFTIHRVVKMDEKRLVTKGDANKSSDSAIDYDEVIGKALTFQDKPLRFPLLGQVSILLNKHKL